MTVAPSYLKESVILDGLQYIVLCVVVVAFFHLFSRIGLNSIRDGRKALLSERVSVSGNGPFFRLKLKGAEIGQLLIISIPEGMTVRLCHWCVYSKLSPV